MAIDLVKKTLELKHKNKSYIFLFPTLYLKNITPIQTYMGFKDFSIDHTLICLFHTSQANMKAIEETCREHKQFDFALVDGDYLYVAFTFLWKKELYDLIKAGKYSKVEGSDRALMMWGKDKEYVDMALTPQSYYSEFASQFQCSAESLAEKGAELVSPPDEKSEYIHASKTIQKQLREDLELVPTTHILP